MEYKLKDIFVKKEYDNIKGAIILVTVLVIMSLLAYISNIVDERNQTYNAEELKKFGRYTMGFYIHLLPLHKKSKDKYIHYFYYVNNKYYQSKHYYCNAAKNENCEVKGRRFFVLFLKTL
ncbi:MAG: hypothetical protein MUE85_10245 [Microscillaceae bacterium]|jgi:hypothetical protein|nr:hypothetical protein [Microscillaceae bacterium]